jgi:hypothetical protein
MATVSPLQAVPPSGRAGAVRSNWEYWLSRERPSIGLAHHKFG